MVKIENVDCPMMRKNIDIAYCIELRMIVDNEIKPSDSEKHLGLKSLFMTAIRQGRALH